MKWVHAALCCLLVSQSALQLCNAQSTIAGPYFESVATGKTGILWKHDNAISARRYLPESMGPGVAIFDYDNDGWMDLYFVNSGPADFFTPSHPLRNALYRNNHDGTFSDVTEKAGVAGRDFGIGVAAGDYDGDGWTDLLVTTYGKLILYHNNHDGTFTDVAKQSGLDSPGLFTSAVWFDADNNGTLDLYVGHFARYDKSLERDCSTNGIAHYCYPKSYDPWPSRLYRNNGNGKFTDISVSSGIGKIPGKSFGVVATDINNDGLLDLFVANDSVPNFLFLNKGAAKFEEIALAAGVAYSPDGAARSGMGVDAADFNQDGFEDLFVANISREMYSLYRNKGDNSFEDVAGPTGIAMATIMDTGWGVRFFDFDLDGWPDLILANGHPDDLIESISSSLRYQEPLLLFHNTGHGYQDVTAQAGAPFTGRYPARGLAVGDLDNDGRPDVVVVNNGGALLLLHNTTATANHWLGLNLEGLAVGARITWSAGGVQHAVFHRGGGSYLSSSDPREILGLGAAQYADWLQVQWPGAIKRVDRFEHVAAGKYYSLAPRETQVIGLSTLLALLALQLAVPPQQQHYNNAESSLAKMQFGPADDEVDQALRIDPNYVPALILKARLALFAHRPDIARSCLVKAVIVAPSSEQAQFFLGMFYYLQNDFALGVSPLEKAQALSPRAPLPSFYLAMTKEAMGDAPAALALYDQAEALTTEKNAQAASVLVAHGRLLFSLGRYDESIARDTLAIEDDRQSRDAWYERAKGLAHQGNYQAAAADGERALTLPALGTSDSQVHFLLGNVYLKLKQPDLAAAHLAKFHAAPQTTQR